MNQEALNETLARLPILIDEEDYNNRTNASSDSNTRSLSLSFRFFISTWNLSASKLDWRIVVNPISPIPLDERIFLSALQQFNRIPINLYCTSIPPWPRRKATNVNSVGAHRLSLHRRVKWLNVSGKNSINEWKTKIDQFVERDCRQELVQLKEENRLLEQVRSSRCVKGCGMFILDSEQRESAIGMYSVEKRKSSKTIGDLHLRFSFSRMKLNSIFSNKNINKRSMLSVKVNDLPSQNDRNPFACCQNINLNVNSSKRLSLTKISNSLKQ